MADYYYNDLGFKVWKSAPYKCYQRVCDEVFGEGAVKISRAPYNDVTLRYGCVDQFLDFQENFKKRLMRLKEKFADTPSYPVLLEIVKEVAVPNKWERAFAKLAALDLMWNDFLFEPIELRTDGVAYIPYSYDMCFDVDVFGDTIGATLRGILEQALEMAKQKVKCEVFPVYPLDDDAELYRGKNEKKLLDELVEFLAANKTMKEGDVKLDSKVVPQLTWKINWGHGFNYSLMDLGAYNPYQEAEKRKHLIIKREAKRIVKGENYLQVMVRMNWFRGLKSLSLNFNEPDGVYYRSLARRTFLEHEHDGALMKDIVTGYKGEETVSEVTRQIAGLIFINDDIENGTYSCSVIMNPNFGDCYVNTEYLRELVKKGEKQGVYDDLRYDNY